MAAESRDSLLENDKFPRKETELEMLEQEENLEAQMATAMATLYTRFFFFASFWGSST